MRTWNPASRMTVGMIPNALGYFKRRRIRNDIVREGQLLWRRSSQAMAASELVQILRTSVSSWSWRALTHGE